MLPSLALVAGGAVIALVGVYFWNHPEHYHRHLHASSPLAAMNLRLPDGAVRFGAALSVIIGLVVAG